MKISVTRTKVAWVRDPNAPVGRPAKGRFRCCGNAPLTDFKPEQGNVTCGCGAVYTWDGWVITPAPATVS